MSYFSPQDTAIEYFTGGIVVIVAVLLIVLLGLSLLESVGNAAYNIQEYLPTLDTLTPFNYDVLFVSINRLGNGKTITHYLIETSDFCDQNPLYILRRDYLPTVELFRLTQAIDYASISCPVIDLSLQEAVTECLNRCSVLEASAIQVPEIFLLTLELVSLILI